MAATDLLTLGDARTACRIAATDATNDADLQSTYVPSVTAVVEDVVGPVVSQSFTRSFDGGVSAVVLLGHTNVSVTSVSESGVSLSSGTDYVVDVVAGIVMRGTAIAPRPFFYGRQNVSITWTTGLCATTATVPANIRLAARIILRQIWQSDQQGTGQGRSIGGAGVDGDTALTPSGFAIPRRAMELLSSIDRLPGMA